MKLRGGEFSTGTMGNFQPELTAETNQVWRSDMAKIWAGPPADGRT